jgi:hypothetical protein
MPHLGYFGNKKCCNSNGQKIQGATGLQGVTGPRGPVGVTGSRGITGFTGTSCSGPTGPDGPNSGTNPKTFIINHPLNEKKYLMHACIEGPEAGVYYRGTGEISNNESVVIHLPSYVDHLATEFTVELTPICSKQDKSQKKTYETSEVENNAFKVYGKDGRFYWTVYGKKNDILVETDKNSVNVHGNGPYKWHY